MKKGLFVVAILGLCLMQFVSAEIILSQPSVVYNFGDNLKIQATVSPSLDSSGFFELNLNCNEENNFYRQYLNLKQGGKKTIDAEILLLPSFTNGGDCRIKASFSGDTKESQDFIISKQINVVLYEYQSEVEAGKYIQIRGNTTKENRASAKGFYEFSVENTSILVSGEVDSSFIINFSFPENAKAKDYQAKVRIYEGLYGEITNEGHTYLSFRVKQTPKRIILNSSENVVPGEQLIINEMLLDQADDEIADSVNIQIIDNNNKLVVEKNVLREDEISFELNSTPGLWKIVAKYDNVSTSQEFSVLILEKASFEIVDGTLIVKNIGNTVYKKSIEISIGDFKETKNVEIGVGEQMEFKLKAPDGNYDIKVSDGSDEFSGNVALTGRSIGVEQVSSNLIFRYPIVWVFLILVLGMLIVLYSRKVIKRTSYSVPVEKEVKIEPQEKKGFEVVNIARNHPEQAEHSLVLEGRKEEASLLTVKINNLSKTKNVSAETLSRLYKAITEKKGSIFESGDFVIGVFSSLNTRTFKNEMPAIKIARQIETLLKEHNKKFREKIDYGIGLSLGEIIAKKDDKFKFTALGNSLNQAKKTAELALGELLLSENMQKKVANEVRTERVSKNGINLYSIKAVMDRDKNKEFISSFLNRQRKS
ncbi:MAG: hypothetical protein NT076_05750 [Candidatus Pacearchaeota archaeon]|nr:hypothetical protein [Candidatus Pacearchaeota archaeon]